jgi:peroxiredoxin
MCTLMKCKPTFWVLALIGIAGLAIVLTGGSSIAEDDEDKVEIGDKVPDFEMTDTEGNTHKLEDFEDKIVVLNFYSQHCPWIIGHNPHMNELAKEYMEKDIVFLGIDAHAGRSLEAIEEHRKEAELPYPILKDVDNKYADKMNAKVTPEIYIVDKDGNLAYHGAFDNRTSPPEEGEVNYVKNALDALLEGNDVEEPRVQAWGCGIVRVQ